jgi:transitional endoplasmic reticulum ATPase
MVFEMCEILEPGEYFKVKEPAVTWENIGGYSEVKERLEELVSLPIKHPDSFKKAGMVPRNGILIWGPPKTGFNAFAEAAANSAGSSYISASSVELMKKEHEITHMYETAVDLAPCIVFIGEADILAPRREAESALISAPEKLALPTATRLLFSEIDKMADRHDIITIGGTNRPDVLDPALLRNGRLDRKVYVPVPDYDDRLDILEMATKDTPLSKDVSFEKLAETTKNYASADLLSLSRQVTLLAIKERGDKFDEVEANHFEKAIDNIPSSLTPELIKRYEEIYKEECKHRYMY